MTASSFTVASQLTVVKPWAGIAAKARADATRASDLDSRDFTVCEPDFTTARYVDLLLVG